MRHTVKVALLSVLALAMTGCRYKGWESFTSATEPSPGPNQKVVGDPYSFGGIGEANGGLKPQTNYGAGSDVNSAAPVNGAFDQPEYGSGQQPGEAPNVAAPGHGQDNGPALQPRPSDQAGGAPLAHG